MNDATTLLEFLGPVIHHGRRTICLAAMHYMKRQNQSGLTSAELKTALVAARVPSAAKYNVSDVLSKAGALVSASQTGTTRTWFLTKTGEEFVAQELGLEMRAPEVVNSVEGLSKLLGAISDDVIRGYVAESLLCYEVDARRAAVVFLWSGAVRSLQDRALLKGAQALNAAIAKHDSKAKQIARIDDFSAIKDTIQLLGFRELGIVDKGQWQTLQDGLTLRNQCGHPTKYEPGPAKVASFIEDIIGIAF
jgi:hypothetical protein